MDDFFNLEFYINIALTVLLTIAAIVSGFNFDLTALMLTSWGFFIVIHSIKYSAYIKNIKVDLLNQNEQTVKE